VALVGSGGLLRQPGADVIRAERKERRCRKIVAKVPGADSHPSAS
jgi:hypothetical protein